MFKRFMQSVMRVEIEEQTSTNLKTVLWIYGAIGAAASVFGVGEGVR